MTAIFVVVIGCFLVARSYGQIDCNQAPTPALQITCRQLTKWDNTIRTNPPILTSSSILPPATAGGLTPQVGAELARIATTAYHCMDLGCLCHFMGGNGRAGTNSCTLPNGRPLRKAIRKEYRQLTDAERQRYNAAVRQIKNSGEYDRLGRIHSAVTQSGSAHSGPAFLPWHREYIKRYEIALRLVDPEVTLPYWDSTLDAVLPDSRFSVMWTDELMGRTDTAGNLITGPFAPWRTLAGRANIRRNIGQQGSLFTEQDIVYVLRQRDIASVLAFTAPQAGCRYAPDWNVLEYTHGNVHIYVGGDMLDVGTSSNDPIFFLHHSFVDFIWELWRQQRQNRFQRESEYPPDSAQCSARSHFLNSYMQPFEPWQNKDGLRNMYTDNLYEYAPRPNCANGGDCGSRFLFCDISHGSPRCASRIVAGARCGAYTGGENPCYNGFCQGGVCVRSAVQPPVVVTTPAPVVTRPPPAASTFSNCFNEHQCCITWAAAGECSRNPGYMNLWCKASCRVCTPSFTLADDCTDRHPKCASWSSTGECTSNPLWMTENCRRSCNLCATPRSATCSVGRARAMSAQPTTVVAAAAASSTTCKANGCFNENICCSVWAAAGQCQSNRTLMACNCAVACGTCNPTGHTAGSCADYNVKCAGWARRGDCRTNPWMLENCRTSCQSCVSTSELSRLCNGQRVTRRLGREVLTDDNLFRPQRAHPPGFAHE